MGRINTGDADNVGDGLIHHDWRVSAAIAVLVVGLLWFGTGVGAATDRSDAAGGQTVLGEDCAVDANDVPHLRAVKQTPPLATDEPAANVATPGATIDPRDIPRWKAMMQTLPAAPPMPLGTCEVVS